MTRKFACVSTSELMQLASEPKAPCRTVTQDIHLHTHISMSQTSQSGLRTHVRYAKDPTYRFHVCVCVYDRCDCEPDELGSSTTCAERPKWPTAAPAHTLGS